MHAAVAGGEAVIHVKAKHVVAPLHERASPAVAREDLFVTRPHLAPLEGGVRHRVVDDRWVAKLAGNKDRIEQRDRAEEVGPIRCGPRRRRGAERVADAERPAER